MANSKSTVAASFSGLFELLKKAPAAVTSGQNTEGLNAIKNQINDIVTGDVANYTADGAIDPTIKNSKISKGSAAAMTLRAPTDAEEGKVICIYSGSAYAHVITATDLIDDGVTGGAKDTITFGAFVGASITLIASDKKWTVLAKNVATIA